MESARRAGTDAELVASLAWVRRLALAIVRDDALADDIAQDVVCTALRRSPDRRPGSLAALRAWLATVARRTAIDRVRSESSRRARERAVARPEADGGSAEAVERGARSQRVVAAVMQLDEPYRSAILLRYLDQLPMAEVARRLRLSETTVRARLSTALGLLRSRLDGEFRESSDSWALALLGAAGREASTATGPSVGIPTLVHGAILMNAKWVAAAAAVVLVGLAAWVATAKLDAGQRAAAAPSGADARLDPLAQPATPESQRSTAAGVLGAAPLPPAGAIGERFLVVRSSIGLPLPFVDLLDARGDWKRAELDRDRCALDPAIPLPTRVHAPGHLARDATKPGEEILLEPDALLTLEAAGLRTRTRSIRVENRFRRADAPLTPEMRQAVAFGFLSDDRWCVAASPEFLRAAVFEDELEVEVLWPDHRRADVSLRAVPGARGHWTVPIERGADGSALRVHVRRPAGETAGDVIFLLAIPHEGGADFEREYFEWGRVAIYSPNELWMDEQRLAADGSDYTFDFVPSGVPLTLAAHDEATCAYARLSFVHDGTDRTLELQSAFVLRGCLLAADDRSPVTTANLVWEFGDDDQIKSLWRCEKFPLATDPAGCFEARGPMHMSTDEQMQLAPPSRLAIRVEAPGFESFERIVDTGGARSFDCGELSLTRSAAQITLAPGHGVTPKSFDGEQLRISSMPEVFWDVRGGALNADGSLSVYIDEAEESAREQRLFTVWDARANNEAAFAWPPEPARWLTIHLILDDLDESWLFERQADGRYAAFPRRELELELKCEAPPPERPVWTLGWQLQDQWGWLGVDVPRVAGELSRVRFSIPVGARLWWSESMPPSVLDSPATIGGTVSVDAALDRLILK